MTTPAPGEARNFGALNVETILTLAAVALLLVVTWYVFKLLLITAIYVIAMLLIPVAHFIDSVIHIVRNTK